MTGRDLIIYILQNNLEDKLIFEDGNIPGLMTIEEVAKYFDTGTATVKAWIACNFISSVTIGNNVYIPQSALKHSPDKHEVSTK